MMRYGLTSTLLGDGYYSFDNLGEHRYSYWYDEFETNLGYPTQPAQRLKKVWVRFFDHGLSIVYPGTGKRYSDITVTDANLQTLKGYDGPYYRFRGGQDPDWNNGEKFDKVTLSGQPCSRGKGKELGDGIILLKEPKVVVADIIIDNFKENWGSTGSDEAQYTGTWSLGYAHATGSIYTDNPYWSQVCYRTKESFGYKWSVPGSGENTVTYTPTIGVPGQYEVFEWHGWHGTDENSSVEASNVPYEIVYQGGIATGTIDQTIH